MFRQLSQKARKQEGFTLVELIVVVAILGILAAVLTPRVLEAITDARTHAAESSAKQIQLAMERYLIANNAYPQEQDIDGTTADARVTALVNVLRDFSNVDPATISDVTYTGFLETDGTGDAGPTDDPLSYTMVVTFTQGNLVYTITPAGAALTTN